MYKTPIVLFCLLLLLLSMPAFARDRVYLGADILQDIYRETGYDDDYPIDFRIKGGYAVTRRFSVEAQYITGLVADTVKLDNVYGVFIRGNVARPGRSGVYGLAGYTKYKISGPARSVSGYSPAFAAGLDYSLSVRRRLYLNFEFAFYTDINLSTMGLGVRKLW
jgi:hypothetical protein